MFHLGRFFTLAGGRRIPDAKTTTPRQKFPYGHVSRSHALDRGTGWDGLGRLVGRVQHRDRSMFIEVGTTGRLVRGVRVWVAACPANNSQSQPRRRSRRSVSNQKSKTERRLQNAVRAPSLPFSNGGEGRGEEAFRKRDTKCLQTKPKSC